MKELLRSNDPVVLSFVSALLEEADIGFIVLDTNMSVLEGSIGILPRRVLVEDDSIDQARSLLTEAGVGHVIVSDENSHRTTIRQIPEQQLLGQRPLDVFLDDA